MVMSQAKQVIQTAAQYTLAMSMELSRRALAGSATDLSSLPEDKRKRILELSAYFTIPAMDPSHVTLALFSAMNLANRNKQLSSALSFANALIEKGTNAKFKDNVSFQLTLSLNRRSTTNNVRRPNASRQRASDHPATRSRSNSTLLPSSKCAARRTRRFMRASRA